MGNNGVNAGEDHGTKKKSAFQVQSLEKLYTKEKYPNKKAMEEYAASLNLRYNQIKIWFAEKRRKERKESIVRGSIKNCLGVGRAQERCCSIKAVSEQLASQKKCMKKKLSAVSSYKQWVEQRDRHKIFGNRVRECGVGRRDHTRRNHPVQLQVLFSKDYILKKVFRKDGPPLGVEFDPLPLNAFCYHTDSEDLHSCQDSQRIPKRRKVLVSPTLDQETTDARNVSGKKYGIGKGLMTVWHATHATNSTNLNFPSGIYSIDGSTSWEAFGFSSQEKLSRVSKGLQQLKVVPKKCIQRKKLQEKKKPPIKKRKVPCRKDVNCKKPHPTECKLLFDEPKSLEQSSALALLADDEELELRELQAGPNPLRCSAHFTSNGRHGCPLCKDLLARFPPQTVKMKQPFCTRPWDSSPELVKKLFKIFRFFYANAVAIEICPFTLDDFAQAFIDKDSLLLGKVHVTLLKLLLFDVEQELAAGFIPRAAKDCRFLGFLNFIREQEFDVNFWSQSLNPLTWTEILRQVLVAAGFGSNHNAARREIFNKEMNQMAKYGLRPRTLKGELFSLLSEQGSTGLKVADLAKASQIIALNLPNTTEEVEQLIYSTLSSDITLFEKIAPSAYRLRVNPQIKGKVDFQSDAEDSGSVDDVSGEVYSSSNSSDDSDDSEELSSASSERRVARYKARHKSVSQTLTEHTEIDESYSGEAWVLGLMEGEYSNLSIEEKLDALVALVDLSGAGSSLRTEEPTRTTSAIIPNVGNHSSGGKIKKSSALPDSFPVNSSTINSETSNRGPYSRTKYSEATEESGSYVHPLKSIYLGADRRYNGYWLFVGPCNGNDPGHRRIYFESSEDGHWEIIDTSQALGDLLSALDCRGTREAHLFRSLQRREEILCRAMDDYMTSEYRHRQTPESNPSELYTNSGDGSSPISDVDNIMFPAQSTNDLLTLSSPVVIELGKNGELKEQKWARLQAFDKWIWNAFYSTLNSVKRGNRSFMESLARCESCHDLYWRDEKHCRICHATFEIDFDLEERYAIHVATCREIEDSSDFPKHKVHSSQLQALKAAIHAIEAGMPEAALSGMWTRSAHKLWVKRLRRTSSLPELLQVLADFVGAINEDWLYESASSLGSNTAVDEIIVYFQAMPQTTSAVALWIVKLDLIVAPHLEKLQLEKDLGSKPQVKRRRACSK